MAHTQKIAHPVPAVCPGEISLFESAFNHAQIGMAISSIDGTLLSVNQSFASMLGCDPHDIIGRNYREITAADDQSTAGDFVTNLFKTVKTSHTFNKRYVNKSGAEVHSRVTLTIVPATGATEGFVIIQAVDISDMTKLEQNLAKEIEEKDILIKEVHHRV
ncbi:MAG TPA: PAS domain S-box protein, partial [Spirochaetota bacterium]|nr:PAS domain S-box protein [Spirochaetota bacterium]